jgi:hypothetical protein
MKIITNYPNCPECVADRPCFDCYSDQIPYTDEDHEIGMAAHYSATVGDTIKVHVDAPGIGFNEYQVTRVTDKVYGKLIHSTVRELTAADVI